MHVAHTHVQTQVHEELCAYLSQPWSFDVQGNCTIQEYKYTRRPLPIRANMVVDGRQVCVCACVYVCVYSYVCAYACVRVRALVCGCVLARLIRVRVCLVRAAE